VGMGYVVVVVTVSSFALEGAVLVQACSGDQNGDSLIWNRSASHEQRGA
jgi:preprotein translocase subunit SecG